jgi:hypothetical protein
MWSQKVGWHLLHWVSQSSLESVMMTSFPMMTEVEAAVLLLALQVQGVLVQAVEVPVLVEVALQDLSDSPDLLGSLHWLSSSRTSWRFPPKVLPAAARKDPDMLKFAAAL